MRAFGLKNIFTKLSKKTFSTSNINQPPYVFINKYTKVICQGMTGKQGTFHTQGAIHFADLIASGTVVLVTSGAVLLFSYFLYLAKRNRNV